MEYLVVPAQESRVTLYQKHGDFIQIEVTDLEPGMPRLVEFPNGEQIMVVRQEKNRA